MVKADLGGPEPRLKDASSNSGTSKQQSTQRYISYELTVRFGSESVKLIQRDLGHCPRRQSCWGQWARSRGINPDPHTKRVDNSGSATTVSPTKYLYNDEKCLLLSERWSASKLSAIFVVLVVWPYRPISIKNNILLRLLPCQGSSLWTMPW